MGPHPGTTLTRPLLGCTLRGFPCVARTAATRYLRLVLLLRVRAEHRARRLDVIGQLRLGQLGPEGLQHLSRLLDHEGETFDRLGRKEDAITTLRPEQVSSAGGEGGGLASLERPGPQRASTPRAGSRPHGFRNALATL